LNREKAAAVAAWNTGLLIFFAVVLFALLNHPGSGVATPPPWATGPESEGRAGAQVERGWAVYQGENCSTCHSIAGQGSPRYPLDGVGDRLAPAELRLWVVDPQQMRPGVRKRAYDHLSDEDVAALVALLEILRER
jgi:mono/diheme cytochrome c family protein